MNELFSGREQTMAMGALMLSRAERRYQRKRLILRSVLTGKVGYK